MDSKKKLRLMLNHSMKRAVQYLSEQQAAAALKFMDDPNRIPMPAMALDTMTTLLIDKWGAEEYESEIGAPIRSAKALLAQSLDTYIALDTWSLIRGRQLKSDFSKLPTDAEDLRNTVSYLSVDSDKIQEITEIRSKYGLSTGMAKVFLVLQRSSGKTVAKSDILARVYATCAPEDIPDIKIIDQLVCQMRKKLPGDLRVETIRGMGYRMVSGNGAGGRLSAES